MSDWFTRARQNCHFCYFDYIYLCNPAIFNGFILDTSKRRHIIRGKQAVCSRKLKDLLMEYSVIVSNMEFDKLFELCDKGLFPWRSNGSHSTIITCKELVWFIVCNIYRVQFVLYIHTLRDHSCIFFHFEIIYMSNKVVSYLFYLFVFNF